ncbi:MAG: substrate-binding domain-containing protein [Marinobacter sp.]|nr:substrate-binding domain-containing protein [Marinobacter sp.]
MHIKKLNIAHAWVFTTESGKLFDPLMLGLLRDIDNTGKLTVAAERGGISYRHAWNLLNRWAETFGMPLVTMQKGQGTRLSALGNTLLWAERKAQARLGPQVESMASELNVELQQLLEGAHPVLRMHASHGYAVALLATYHEQLEMNLQYCDPQQALTALNRGECDIAGFHLPVDPRFGRRIFSGYRPMLSPDDHVVIRFITRQQGLMIRQDSADRITRLSDLADPAIRFINRQRNSGTRALFRMLLQSVSLSEEQLEGYDREEYTHSAIAAYVASGMADAGFGVEAAARQFGLGFIPLAAENYLMICRRDRLGDDKMQNFLSLIRTPEFAAAVDELPGYAPVHCGRIEELTDLEDALQSS